MPPKQCIPKTATTATTRHTNVSTSYTPYFVIYVLYCIISKNSMEFHNPLFKKIEQSVGKFC